MSLRFYSLFFSMANSSRSFSSMAHESSASVHPRRPSASCFLPPHGSTAIKGVWRCKTVGDRVRTAITAVAVGDYAAMMKTGIVCWKHRFWQGRAGGRGVRDRHLGGRGVELDGAASGD